MYKNKYIYYTDVALNFTVNVGLAQARPNYVHVLMIMYHVIVLRSFIGVRVCVCVCVCVHNVFVYRCT